MFPPALQPRMSGYRSRSSVTAPPAGIQLSCLDLANLPAYRAAQELSEAPCSPGKTYTGVTRGGIKVPALIHAICSIATNCLTPQICKRDNKVVWFLIIVILVINDNSRG